MAIFYLIIFLFGLAAGSFLNCVIYRLEKEENFLKGRSFCPSCRHELSWQDLVPLLSFVLLGGRCRYCRQKISFQYPLVELATGFIFLFLFLFFFTTVSTNYTMVYLLLISCFLIVIFVYDLKRYIIPDKIIFPAIVFSLIYRLFGTFGFRIWDLFRISNFEFRILNPLFSAFGATLFFLLIVLISRGKWMGVGDIKLAFFMGLFLGFPNILAALFLAFFIGAIIGIGLMIARKKTLKSEVPFGPFLVAGTFIALFWGEKIIGWYLNLISKY